MSLVIIGHSLPCTYSMEARSTKMVTLTVTVYSGGRNKFQIGYGDFEVELGAAVVNFGSPPLLLLVSIVAVRPHSDSIEKIWMKIHGNTISIGEYA